MSASLSLSPFPPLDLAAMPTEKTPPHEWAPQDHVSSGELETAYEEALVRTRIGPLVPDEFVDETAGIPDEVIAAQALGKTPVVWVVSTLALVGGLLGVASALLLS